jgi:lipopolysaccharide exporter
MLKTMILRGTAWLLLGRFVSQAIGLVSTLVAARLLVPADFGLVAVAMSVFMIAGALVELPVAAALVQLKTITDRDFNTAWTLNIIRGLIVTVLMFIAAWPVAAVFGDPRLIALISAMASYPFLLGFRNSRFEMYIRNMDFKWEAMVEIGTKVASFAVMFWVALATGSYWALPLGLIASGVIALVMSFALCPQIPGLSLSEFRKFFGFSVWLGLAQIADSVREAAASLFIGKLLGNAALGTYAVGIQFADRMELFLYAPMERTMFAAFSSIQDDLHRVRAAYLSSLHASFAISLPICVGIGLLAKEIVAITLGPEWASVALVLAFAAPITAIYLLGAISVSIATALGRTRSVFFLKAVSTCLYIPLMVLGALQFGMIGVLWAGVFGAVVWCGLSFRLMAKVIHVSMVRQVAVVGRSLAAALVMSVVVTWARVSLSDDPVQGMTGLLVQAGILSSLGAVVYLAAHAGLWIAANRPQGIERQVSARFSALSPA